MIVGHRIIKFAKTVTLTVSISCFLLVPLFYLKGHQEKQFLHGIAKYFQYRALLTAKHSDNPGEAEALKLMDSVHHLMKNRKEHVGTVSLGNPSSIFRWVSDDLNDSAGACGAFSMVLGRLLMELGYEVRKIGLEKGNNLSIHQVVEVKTQRGWFVLDPTFNFAFQRPDGKLASAFDLSDHWEYYRRQIPDDYNPDYDYQSYHYTNWKRLGIFGKILRSVFDSDMPGEEFSAFLYIANRDQYLPWLIVTLGIFMLVIYMTLSFFLKRL